MGAVLLFPFLALVDGSQLKQSQGGIGRIATPEVNKMNL